MWRQMNLKLQWGRLKTVRAVADFKNRITEKGLFLGFLDMNFSYLHSGEL